MIKLTIKKYIILSIIFILLNSIFISVSAELHRNDQNKNFISPLGPGDYSKIIYFDGHIRSYRLHIPPSYVDVDPMPLVFVLHGSGAGANSFSTKIISGMDEKADEEGFIAVYPNGELLLLSRYFKHPIAHIWDISLIIKRSREWNRWDDNNFDDVGFIRELINHLELKLNVDSSRIYVMGSSGGAMMTHRLGAELSDRIAAIAPICGSIGGLGYVSEKDETLPPYIIPNPDSSLPVIIFHGMKDKNVPYDGGWKQVINWNSYESWVYVMSVNESVSFWIENNNCNPIPDVETSESEKIIIETYTDGNDNSKVVLVSYEEGGHEWFKSPRHELSAIDLAWEFFSSHSKN
jgi:polyhydroxybutyrate depolymerase